MTRTLDCPKPQVVLALAWLTLASGLCASGDSRRAPDDAAFLDDLEHRAVRYFVEQSDPATGLARDRAPADGTFSRAPSSVAATGFALTAWCIADDHGWLRPGEARERV